MNGRKAAGYRAASRIIGYGGVIACIIAAIVWYVVHIAINKETVEYLQLGGKNVFPKDRMLAAVAIVAVAVIVIAIVLRIISARCAKRFAEDVAFLDAQEESEENEDDNAYNEEPLAPIDELPAVEKPVAEPAPAPEVLAAPAEEAATVSEAPARDRVIASLQIRIPTNPAKKAKRDEKKAKRVEKTAKLKTSLGKKVNKILPPEKREELKKKVDSIKRAAKVIVPVAVACVVVAKVAKKRHQKKLEKEKARNRRQFYQWLG